MATQSLDICHQVSRICFQSIKPTSKLLQIYPYLDPTIKYQMTIPSNLIIAYAKTTFVRQQYDLDKL